MKGLILSGGRGTRLRPITFTSAKQLVPVANKPILFYGIEALAASGIKEIGIVVGDTRQEIKDAVGDGSRFGVSVTYIEQEAPLGLAHAVLVSEPFLGTEPFCMYLGDNLIRERLEPLVTRFREEKPNSQILLAAVSNPSQFGVAELRDGQVVRLVEKPKTPPSNLALVGVYMFDAAIFEAVKAIRPSPRGELEITDAIQWLIDHGRLVRPHVIEGWWKDTGRLEDMLEANRIILDSLMPRTDGLVEESEILGKVVVEAGARIVHSTVRGPAIIGKGALIENAYIGPFTSVGDGVVVRGSEVEHSILLEGASVSDVGGRIESSLIGRNVSIYRTTSKPRSFNFMLGDRSEVGLHLMSLNDDAKRAFSLQDYGPARAIDGVQIVDLKRFNDDGGALTELGRLQGGLHAALPGFEVKQINYSELEPGAIKAFHLHRRQTDVWFVPPGDKMLLVLLDVRAESVTQDARRRIVLGDGTSRLVRIPPGVAHGVKNLAATRGRIIYFVDTHFAPAPDQCDEGRLPWDFAGPEIWDVVRG